MKLNVIFSYRQLNSDTFDGLTKVDFFSLADNNLEVVPKHLWKGIPYVKTLDMGRSKIRELTDGDFNVSWTQTNCYIETY